MHTALVGTDFNKVSLDLLEKVYFDEQSIESFLLTLPKTTPIRDIVILATCNRMELYYTCQNYELAKVWLIDHLSHFFGIDRSVLEPVLYHKRCLDTVLHLYEVSSGMKSMIFGENEILAQVKKAYSMCQKYRPLNSHMNKLFQSAIHVGKRVRDVLAINKGAYSISSIAVDAMTEVYDDLYTDKKILIVGTGTMATRAIKKLLAMGHQELFITNRSQEPLDMVSEQFGLGQIPYHSYKKSLSEFDCIYYATSTKHNLLSYDDCRDLKSPLLIVDVGVPRNVHSSVSDLTGISLITIDQLKSVADKTILERQQFWGRATCLVLEFAKDFEHWYDKQKSLPVHA
tara:strand:- start:588 stop:1616 length:1029 start_codon:yes stop_codon:yes gene_type:complete